MDIDDRQLATWYAAGRIALAATMLLSPKRAAAGWIGLAGRDTGVAVLARSFAARDMALGAGTLLALRDGTPVRRWLQLSAVSDAVDGAASLLAAGRLGWGKALAVGTLAGSGLATGAYLAGRLA